MFGAIHFDVTDEDNEQAAKEKTKVWISRSVEQRLLLGRDSKDGLLGAAAGSHWSSTFTMATAITVQQHLYGYYWRSTVGTHNNNCYFSQLAVAARMSCVLENGGVLSAFSPLPANKVRLLAGATYSSRRLKLHYQSLLHRHFGVHC